jgi:hypothetical protein
VLQIHAMCYTVPFGRLGSVVIIFDKDGIEREACNYFWGQFIELK